MMYSFLIRTGTETGAFVLYGTVNWTPSHPRPPLTTLTIRQMGREGRVLVAESFHCTLFVHILSISLSLTIFISSSVWLFFCFGCFAFPFSLLYFCTTTNSFHVDWKRTSIPRAQALQHNVRREHFLIYANPPRAEFAKACYFPPFTPRTPGNC